MHVESLRNFGEEYPPILSGGVRKQLAADGGSNRRYAVVGCHIDEPGLHGPDPIRRHSGHRAGIVHSQEKDAAPGVREGHQFALEIVGVRGDHATLSEPHLLELSAAVFVGAALAEKLLGRIEHLSG